MTMRTTIHLSIPRRAALRAWLRQYDPLALGSLAIVVLIIVLALLRVCVLALLGSFPASAAAQPLPPIIIIATARPLPTAAAAPTADPLAIEISALRQRVAELESAPTPEAQIVYAEQQPAPPVQPAPLLAVETPAPPEPPAATDPPADVQAEREQAIQDRMRGNEVGGSGKMPAPDFGQMQSQPASADAAARWCAAAASAGQARCAP